MSKAKKKSPGGARAGAGAPAKPKEEKLVRRIYQLSPLHDRFIKALAEETGTSEAVCIRQAIDLVMKENNIACVMAEMKARKI